ncbi:MAG: aminotransferase class I/II-fold pyridoxal phosphate-dependent enzyme [Planctomycetes bacterium]|nr:aminotransferase class I/II-fold pyridoxal phosphate-dependent enzyme [Planctomycetota bacterium]
MKPLSEKAARFTESVIREMTRRAIQHGAVNLAQGFPDFPCPREIKEAAKAAIDADINQYAITWGARPLREAIAAKARRYNGLEVDPDTMITVCCGSTEAMISALMGVVNADDEVVLFEPFYENYGPDAILSGARPRLVRLRPDAGGEFHFDEKELAAAFNARTKAIIVNTPNNPTGKVFSRDELALIATLCQRWDALAVTDEIYEHILYDGCAHHSIAALPGMADRTITVNACSKTYSVTGWRVGWCLAAPAITAQVRKVHDFLTVGAPAPLQEAAVVALNFPDDYYRALAADYLARRDFLLAALTAAGFACYLPRGAYYILTDISRFGFPDDVAFADHLVREIGVAAVPGSSFFEDRREGARLLRFAFAKKMETLRLAAERLRRLATPA